MPREAAWAWLEAFRPGSLRSSLFYVLRFGGACGSSSPYSGGSAQAFSGAAGAFGHRLEFGPHHAGCDVAYSSERAEAAVAASHHPLAADQAGVVEQAFGHQVRMLDKVVGGVNNAGYDIPVVGQFDVLEYAPLMRVARIARLQ